MQYIWTNQEGIQTCKWRKLQLFFFLFLTPFANLPNSFASDSDQVFLHLRQWRSFLYSSSLPFSLLRNGLAKFHLLTVTLDTILPTGCAHNALTQLVLHDSDFIVNGIDNNRVWVDMTINWRTMGFQQMWSEVGYHTRPVKGPPPQTKPLEVTGPPMALGYWQLFAFLVQRDVAFWWVLSCSHCLWCFEALVMPVLSLGMPW